MKRPCSSQLLRGSHLQHVCCQWPVMTGCVTEFRVDLDSPDAGSKQCCNVRQQAAQEEPDLLAHQKMQRTADLLGVHNHSYF